MMKKNTYFSKNTFKIDKKVIKFDKFDKFDKFHDFFLNLLNFLKMKFI